MSKAHVFRKICNSPSYLGLTDVESPKYQKVDEIIDNEFRSHNGKLVIFCEYLNQVKAYAERYSRYGVCAYFGKSSNEDSEGYKLDINGSKLHFLCNERGDFVRDENGYLIISEKNVGKPIKAIDYERDCFQNGLNHRIFIATMESGYVGITLTSDQAMIFDNIPKSYIYSYQAQDRIHRIDDTNKKHDVRYYHMIAQYHPDFLADVKEQYPYYSSGTLDEIAYQRLQGQSRLFHRLMDGVGDEREMRYLQENLITLNIISPELSDVF
jgi:hypothetical protein